MQRILLAGALALTAGSQVFAADLPTPYAPPPRAPAAYAAPGYNWSGFYLGLNAGAAFVNQGAPTNTVNTAGISTPGISSSSTGFAGGGQVGANFQSDRFVFGLEADADYLSNESILPGTAQGGTDTHRYKLDLLSTVRGRIGYAADRALFYATGGFAMGEYQATRTQTSAGVGPVPTGTTDTFNQLRLGWAAGAGFEYALANNWTARAQWLIAGLESSTYVYAGANATQSVPTEYVNVVRAGINYKFGY